jgi:hypothetical protein
MATTTPMQAFPVMEATDDPDIPADIMALAVAVEKRVVGVYNNVADRDAKIASPQEGQVAYLKDSNTLTFYTGAAWTDVVPDVPSFTSGAVVPDNATGSNGDVFFKI